ncbi:hypothetical protein CIPAW_01G001700 [Carya illinoinensis]|uniref:Uncharacterized protein n=1 Tax=Carya illinoinensis TaxID=32201 RepID=A0A8T1RI62_CARIL|nr:hypothetical protein CIPAW_01G001700 [Carya illinoinensis]KAG6728916.1 hypothetical protein I3842_01G001100 [Carya illinoinensis]
MEVIFLTRVGLYGGGGGDLQHMRRQDSDNTGRAFWYRPSSVWGWTKPLYSACGV